MRNRMEASVCTQALEGMSKSAAFGQYGQLTNRLNCCQLRRHCGWMKRMLPVQQQGEMRRQFYHRCRHPSNRCDIPRKGHCLLLLCHLLGRSSAPHDHGRVWQQSSAAHASMPLQQTIPHRLNGWLELPQWPAPYVNGCACQGKLHVTRFSTCRFFLSNTSICTFDRHRSSCAPAQ